jgi:hypothetical protein
MTEISIPTGGEREPVYNIDFRTPARTIRFSLDGVHYELALSKDNVHILRSLLSHFIRVSRVVRREDI